MYFYNQCFYFSIKMIYVFIISFTFFLFLHLFVSFIFFKSNLMSFLLNQLSWFYSLFPFYFLFLLPSVYWCNLFAFLSVLVPDQPTDLRAINITDNKALLLWRPALATVDQYIITYHSEEGQLATCLSSMFSFSLRKKTIKYPLLWFQTFYLQSSRIIQLKGSNWGSFYYFVNKQALEWNVRYVFLSKYYFFQLFMNKFVHI